MFDFLSDIGEAVSDVIDAAGNAVSKGMDTINSAYNKASDAIDVITETVVSSPDILADMIADSTVGQYWSDFWDLEVDSVNAIGGLLEDTAEELANDEDVPGFIRDYMNGFIGADVPYTRWGKYGARFRGVGDSLSGMWKGISSMLGHPCQTEDNIVNAFIMAGDATKYAVHNPANAVNMVEKMADNWWNSKNTYEKISAEWEFLTNVTIVAAMWEASAGSAGSKTAEFAETTTEAGEIAAEAGEAGGIVGSEGIAAVEGAAGEAAEAIEGVAGKGKIRI